MSASKFILAVLMAALLVNLALAQNSSLSLCNDSVYTDTSNDDAIRMSTVSMRITHIYRNLEISRLSCLKREKTNDGINLPLAPTDCQIGLQV